MRPKESNKSERPGIEDDRSGSTTIIIMGMNRAMLIDSRTEPIAIKKSKMNERRFVCSSIKERRSWMNVILQSFKIIWVTDHGEYQGSESHQRYEVEMRYRCLMIALPA